MERKSVIVKKESKMKKDEEIRFEFSMAGNIRITKSEIFSESSLPKTEIVNIRRTVHDENSSSERISRRSTESKSDSGSPRMRILQKKDPIKATVSDKFDQMKDSGRIQNNGNPAKNEPSISNHNIKDVNLYDLHEASYPSEILQIKPPEINDAKKNAAVNISVGCNPSNGLKSRTSEDFENNNSEKSPRKNYKNAESHDIKKAKDSKYVLHAQNQIEDADKRKKLEDYMHEDNILVSSEDEGKNSEVGVIKEKGNVDDSINFLGNSFKNMEDPTETDLKSKTFNSEKGELSKFTIQLKRKLTDDHSLPNKKLTLRNSLQFCLPVLHFNAENRTRKTYFVSKNIGLLKKLNEGVRPRCSPEANLIFNDDIAQFCFVKCRQTGIGSKKSTRQPMEKSCKLGARTTTELNQNLSLPKSYLRIRSQDLQKYPGENFSHPKLIPEESTKTEEENGMNNNSSAVENENAETGEIELRSFNDEEEEYQHLGIDNGRLEEQKSHLDLGKEICVINDHFNLMRDLKTELKKIEEPTYEEEKSKSLEKERSSFITYSCLILFMAILSFGSHQYYK